jgi:hypothetical protein
MNSYSEEDTDNETHDSWNETDEEDEENETDEEDEENEYYGPEEIIQTKFNIVVVQKYASWIHGPADKEMNSHFLVMERLKYNYNLNFAKYKYLILHSRLEIAECIYLPSQHCIGILKTFWLKLLQRKWKNIYKERKLCISKRCNPNSLKYREIHGKWPNYCLNYPGLKGMLSELS